MLKKRRLNVRSEFESVYLRTNAFQAALNKVPREEVEVFLAHPKVKQILFCNASKIYNKYADTLPPYGFELEDLASMATVYAVSFLQSKYTAKTEKDKLALMSRYVSQKLFSFLVLLGNKYQFKIRFHDVYLEEVDSLSIAIPDEKQSQSQEDTLADLQDKLAIAQQHPQSAHTGAQMEELHKAVSVAQRTIADTKLHNTELSKQLKEALLANPHKHAEQLCHYASSKCVPADLRRLARRYCTKFGINYKAWAQAKIQAKPDSYLEYGTSTSY